jgi:hypothetical protein
MLGNDLIEILLAARAQSTLPLRKLVSLRMAGVEICNVFFGTVFSTP